MLKTLFATLLLTFNVSIPRNDICVSKTPKYQVVNPDESSQVYGIYNFRANIEYQYIWENVSPDHYMLIFEDIGSDLRIVPISSGAGMNGATAQYQDSYLRKIEFVVGYDTLDLTFYCYNMYVENQFSIHFVDNELLVDISYPYLMFNVRSIYYVADDFYFLFNALFTKQDNGFVKSYTGYYNFLSATPQFSENFMIYGSIYFNNKMYSSMFSNSTGNYLYCGIYDVYTGNYTFDTYDLPFNSSSVVYSNVIFSGAKMASYNYDFLAQAGVFQYVRDSSLDNTTFGDLIFSVMDAPIYFLSRLLSFELFGINMFIALCGMITLLMALLVIRKFF